VRNGVASVILLLACATGCDRCLAKRPPDVSATQPTTDAANLATPAPPPASVSLLRWTDARVAVSSTVDNPKDYPEHLIDGKLDTAWNGRTGDLTGFIAFRVPREAHVASVQLTVGFDKKDKDGRDLFTANHRISRVKVIRDKVLLREVTLDIAERGLQSIAVDQPGGDFEIRVVATEAGTNARWKELVVSEFVVLGDPGTARRSSPHLPRVRIGSLDAAESQPAGEDGGDGEPGVGPWPSITSYCAAFEVYARRTLEKRRLDAFVACADMPPPSCRLDARTPIAGAGPFVSTAQVTTSNGVTRTRSVAVETDKGWWPRMIGIDGADECQIGDFATETGDLRATKAIAPGAIAVETERHVHDPMIMAPELGGTWVKEDAERILHVCRATSADVRCDERHVLGRHSGRLGDDGPTAFERWNEHHTYGLDPSDGGTILLR
jgi:hypothetical protein